MKFVYLFLAIALEVFGSSMLLASNGFTRLKPSLLMLLAFGGCFYFLSQALKYMPLSIAYAIWAGLGIILTACVSYFIFKQAIDTPAIIGIVFIVIGVLIMNLFSNTLSH